MDRYLGGMSFKPSELAPWQIEDAQRLKRLYALHKPKGISQLDFGQRYDIGNQGAVWQYLNGKRPLNIKAATGFARGLGVELKDISPKLASQLDAVNSNPRLRELFDECVNLTDDQLNTLRVLAAALRASPPK